MAPSPDRRLERVDVIGVPITATDMGRALSYIEENLDASRGEYLCLSNVHTTVTAHDDPAYWQVQRQSLMSLPDGKPLSVVGRSRAPGMGRVTGPDLMREIFSVSAERGYRHFLYGSTPRTLDALAGALERDYPGLCVCGREPSVFRDMSEAEEEALARRINAARPDFVWVGIGAPRQEALCHRLRGRVDALMAGVGGAFDILAGITPEAPRWMQDAGLEWLYRLSREPRRLFGRYLVTNAKFIFYLLSGRKRKTGE